MAPLGLLPILITVISLSVGMPSPTDYQYMSDEEYQADYYNDQEDYYSENNESNSIDEQASKNLRTPKFVSTEKSIMVNEGDVIKLPCTVDSLGDFVLLWKKVPKGGQEIIVALNGNLIDKTDTRVMLEKGTNSNNLIISLAEVMDEGEYICQLSAPDTTEIKHTVSIRVPPKIRVTGSPAPKGEENMITVEAGRPVEMACQILKGSPRPDIVWSRKERSLPSGEHSEKAESISFPVTNRHHSGTYICSADNGFADPVEATIKLNVEHKPVIEPEQTFIHTKDGDETKVTCIVHSSPHSTVTWYKDGKVLPEKLNLITQRGNRHTLTITKITGKTHGKYGCRARNDFGEDMKTIEVSGKAMPAEFKSSQLGENKKKYELEWVAESITEVTEFKVEYKKTKEDGDWMELMVKSSRVDIKSYAGKVVIKGLDPSTEYEARVSSKNDFGYSNVSPVFKFHTANDSPSKDTTSKVNTTKVNTSTVNPSKQIKTKKPKPPQQEPITHTNDSSDISRATISELGLLLVFFVIFL